MDLLKSLFFLVDIDDLPAEEDTRANKKCYEAIITTDTIEVTADQDYSAGDFTLWGSGLYNLCGIVNANVVAGDTMSLRVKDGIVVVSSEIGAGSVFNTEGQEVYFDPSDGNFYDTHTAGDGRVGVGNLRLVMDAEGAIAFYKRRYYKPDEDT